MCTLEQAVKFIDSESSVEEKMPSLQRFFDGAHRKEFIPPLEELISQYYMDMSIADKLPYVGCMRDILVSNRFGLPAQHALVLAHLVVVSSTIEPTPKVTSDSTFLCAKIMRDEFTLFAYKILVAHMITAAFPHLSLPTYGRTLRYWKKWAGFCPPLGSHTFLKG